MDIIGHIVGGGDIGSVACGYDSDDDPETLVNRRIKVSKKRRTVLYHVFMPQEKSLPHSLSNCKLSSWHLSAWQLPTHCVVSAIRDLKLICSI